MIIVNRSRYFLVIFTLMFLVVCEKIISDSFEILTVLLTIDNSRGNMYFRWFIGYFSLPGIIFVRLWVKTERRNFEQCSGCVLCIDSHTGLPTLYLTLHIGASELRAKIIFSPSCVHSFLMTGPSCVPDNNYKLYIFLPAFTTDWELPFMYVEWYYTWNILDVSNCL